MGGLRSGPKTQLPDHAAADPGCVGPCEVPAKELFDELILSVYVDLTDLAWQDFLFDEGPDVGGCVARKRCSRPSCAVFYKCGNSLCAQDPEGRLCLQHLKQEQKRGTPQYGYWCPQNHHLHDLSPVMQRNVIREAQARAKRLYRATVTEFHHANPHILHR